MNRQYTMRALAAILVACCAAPVATLGQDNDQTPPGGPDERVQGRSRADGQPAGQNMRGRGGFEQRRGASRDGERAPDAFSSQYAVLLENNIFLRDRRPRRQEQARPTTRTVTAVAPPEKSWMLVGIVFEDGTFRAYLEDLRNGGVRRTAPGDAIANGAITQVFVDAIAYQVGEEIVWVETGQDLTGARATIPGGSRSGVARSSSPAPSRPEAREAAGGGGGAPGEMTIEERLRMRRLQESGREGMIVVPKDGNTFTIRPADGARGDPRRGDGPRRFDDPQGDPDDDPRREDDPQRGEDPDDDPDDRPQRGGDPDDPRRDDDPRRSDDPQRSDDPDDD